MTVELRAITAEEFPAFHRAEGAVFGMVPTSGTDLEQEASVVEYDRTIAGFDEGHIVSTAAAYSFDMTVPGGATVPVAGVTAVGVAPTHRRQGILRQMMERQLDDVVRRGEPMAILNASEAGIYGRFGYGLASFLQAWEIDTIRAVYREPVRNDLRLRMVPKHEAADVVAPIYDNWRITRPGAVTQSKEWWACVFGDHEAWRGGGKVFVVVCEPTTEHAGGYAIYKIVHTAGPGRWTLELRELASADPEVEKRLWRFILDVDLVSTVKAEARPMDDLLRWRLVDPRQVHTTGVQDYLWVRLLDVEASLAARRYPVDDSLALRIDDEFRPETSGTYQLVAGPDAGPAGVACARSDVPADLTFDVADLGAVYLGGVGVSTLAAAGRVQEHTPGAVARADALFAWPVQPFCATRF